MLARVSYALQRDLSDGLHTEIGQVNLLGVLEGGIIFLGQVAAGRPPTFILALALASHSPVDGHGG